MKDQKIGSETPFRGHPRKGKCLKAGLKPRSIGKRSLQIAGREVHYVSQPPVGTARGGGGESRTLNGREGKGWKERFASLSEVWAVQGRVGGKGL